MMMMMDINFLNRHKSLMINIIFLSPCISYFSLGVVRTLSLFVAVSFSSPPSIFLPLCSLPFYPYSKQSFFFFK